MRNKKSGFSLVELMIVIAVIGLVAGMAVSIGGGCDAGNAAPPESTTGVTKASADVQVMSGQCIMYSTVKGKVTSSGKRLTPYSVAATDGEYVDSDLRGVPINIGGRAHRTSEVLQDDGTYGSSIPYLYWWDTQGEYHQIYVAGGTFVHISDQPMPIKEILINLSQ